MYSIFKLILYKIINFKHDEYLKKIKKIKHKELIKTKQLINKLNIERMNQIFKINNELNKD